MEGGVVDFVLGLGMLKVEQIDKAVTPQHLVRQVRRASLQLLKVRPLILDYLLLCLSNVAKG